MTMRKKMLLFTTMAVAMLTLSLPVMATTGNVSGVIEETWKSAAQQIKTVVNNGAATRCC